MDLQPAAGAVVIDKTQLLELVHEMTDPRPGGAHHLRQVFLIDSGKDALGAAFLAIMRQQQEDPGQTLLAGVEKLVDEILFISEAAGKQMRDEQVRDVLLFVEHARHQHLLNLDQRAIGNRGRRGDAQRLTGKASLAEEVTIPQEGDDRFLTLLGGHRVLHLASPDVEYRIRRVSLAVDGPVRAVFKHGFPARDSRQEGFPIDELSFLLCRSNHWLAFITRHNNLPLLVEDITVRGVFQNSIPANDFSEGGFTNRQAGFWGAP